MKPAPRHGSDRPQVKPPLHGGIQPDSAFKNDQLPLELADTDCAPNGPKPTRERQACGSQGRNREAATRFPSSAPAAWIRLSPAIPTPVYDTYWHFAAKRQEIYFRRLAGAQAPWTDDPILLRFKFTNAYRAADRVSQFLIRDVIYSGHRNPEETFFRTILFKLFNKIETWQLLSDRLGDISYRSYRFEQYDEVLTAARMRGIRIYSGAYIMPSGPRPSAGGDPRKHRNHLRLLEQMMRDQLPARIEASRSLQKSFELLRSLPSIGDFLAYQFATDINYSEVTNFGEGEFVVPGPGARDGITKCFRSLGGLNEAELIRVVADRQQEEFQRLGLSFRTLWGRPLQLIDCQNLFCEVDKYARVRHPEIPSASGRTRIKQQFVARLSDAPRPMFPPKWGLNQRIAQAPVGDPADDVPASRPGEERN
jgi:hypothetical protein